VIEDTYSIILYWSDDDEAFIASVPELPGCMAHGETRGQAIEQIEIAIQIGSIPHAKSAAKPQAFTEVYT
jgi:predicted RNase H-like HicB family nuclease